MTALVPALPETRAAERRSTWAPVYLRIELSRLLRNRRTLVFVVLLPVLLYLSIGASVRGQQLAGADASAYILVSIAIYGAMVATMSVAGTVGVERAQGWSRQLRLTPLAPAGYVLVKIGAATSVASLSIAATWTTGLVAGVRMPFAHWAAATALALVGSTVFSALGLFLGFALPVANVMQFVGLIASVLGFFGGLFFPVEAMPHVLGTIAKLTPAWGVGALARAPLTGEAPWAAIVSVLAWLAVFAAGAAWRFARDTARA